ncbi:hypothetical protein [Sphingomonas paeninsulae]|nr:hypothetical protein [Sphingomonas paeninsulae]
MTLTLRQSVTNYLAVSMISGDAFGKAAVNDRMLYTDLCNGRVLRSALHDRVLQYMTDNEPAAPVVNLFANDGPISQLN